MNNIHNAVLLGLVEGLTEFIPVSSTGHLILCGQLLDFSGSLAQSFDIIIQLGAILAVVFLYRQTFFDLLRPAPPKKFGGKRGLLFLFLTSLPASVLGLTCHSYIKAHLFTPTSVAWALAVGAVTILLVERLPLARRYMSLDEMSPMLAFGIGCFQCLALWPGFSRSGATIMGAMLLGASRDLAAKYFFLAAVPIMFAATGYDIYKNFHLLSTQHILVIATGFLVSFLSALFAVKIFVRLLQKTTLAPFAWYRLVLVPFIFYFWQ